MSPRRSSPGFEKVVQETIDQGTSFLRQHGWLDEKTSGPDVARISPTLTSGVYPRPAEVEEALYRSPLSAAAHEYRGSLTTASAWYELGQYFWCGDRTVPGETRLVPDLMIREAVAVDQLPAAICADRVGNSQRARDLYGWAAGNYLLTEEEILGFANSDQIQPIWEFLPMRAYALICVGDWSEALMAAETAEGWLKKDRYAEKNRKQNQLLPVLLALARYKLEPTAENRQIARGMLDLKAITSREMHERLLCYFYLYNLRSRFGGELLAEGENWE